MTADCVERGAPPGMCEICGQVKATCLWPLSGLHTCEVCRQENPPLAQDVAEALRLLLSPPGTGEFETTLAVAVKEESEK